MASFDYSTIYLGSKLQARQQNKKSDERNETLALTRFLNQTQGKSRDARCRCHGNEQFYCLQMHLDGSRQRNPFCKVIGSNVCRSCAAERARERIEEDTQRVLREIIEHDNARQGCRQTKERALLTHIQSRNQEDDDNSRASRPGIPRIVARHNTPDVRYHDNSRHGNDNSRHHNDRNLASNDDEFCVRSMKSVLKRLSTTMEEHSDEYRLQEQTTEIVPRNVSVVSSRIGFSNRTLSRQTNLYSEMGVDGEMLSQKLSGVFEERCLPPMRRGSTASSTPSESQQLEQLYVPNIVEEKRERRFDEERNGWKEVEEEVDDDGGGGGGGEERRFGCLAPPLMNARSQISRYEMFLRDNVVTLPCVKK